MILQDFINNNPSNWKELLKAKPYCLSVNEDDNFVIFSYNQIESDFNEEIVREARGIILNKQDFSVACWPFTKFFNFREALADKINFSKAKVQEKIDGSIMKLWFNKITNDWSLTTNGVIDAKNCTTAMGTCFYDLFMSSFEMNYGNFDIFTEYLDKDNTYIFEMTHPETKVVIPYEPMVYHIGTRSNISGEEIFCDIGIKKPKEYAFKSFDDILNTVKTLPWTKEGYVVVEYSKAKVKRIKVKSLSYCAAHHMHNNGVITYKRIMELILKNEQAEFCAIFPEYQKHFDKAEAAYKNFLSDVESEIAKIKGKVYSSKKEYAMAVKNSKMAYFFFEVIKPNSAYGYDDYKKFIFEQIGSEKMAEILKLK